MRMSPVKVSVGAGPINLAWHAYFNHYKNAKELSLALAPVFNAEMKDLVAAGATYLQIEDLWRVDAAVHQRPERLHVDQGHHRAVAVTASMPPLAGTSVSATRGATTC